MTIRNSLAKNQLRSLNNYMLVSFANFKFSVSFTKKLVKTLTNLAK